MTEARSPIKAVLFDKDGTLIDYRATWLAANLAAASELAEAAGQERGFADELLRRLGYDPAADSFTEDSPLLWATNAEIATRWSAEPELAAVGDIVLRVERCFADQAAFPPVAVTDLAALFERLYVRGLRLGVATMDNTAATEATLARFGLRDGSRSSPAPTAASVSSPSPAWCSRSVRRSGRRPPRSRWSATIWPTSPWRGPRGRGSRSPC